MGYRVTPENENARTIPNFNMGDFGDGFLEKHIQAVIVNICADPDGAEEDDIEAMVEWAQDVFIRAVVVSLLLKGIIRAKWDQEKNEPVFQLTNLGKEMALEEKMDEAFKFAESLVKTPKG